MRIFCVLLCFAFSSCKLIRLTKEESIVFKSNHMKLDFNDDALEVSVKIDNNDEKFLFDTGASNTAIFDTTLIKDFSTKERINLFSTKDPNGNISSFYTPANIETEMYLFNNQLVTVLPGIKNYCSNNHIYKGIIGSSFLKKNDTEKYLFDFDNLILKASKDNLAEKDYFKVKAKFFNNHFAIYLNINGHEEPFLFDTGNIAYPLIIGSDSNIKPISYTEFIGSEGIVASGNLTANSKYSNENDLLISKYKMNTPIYFTSTKMMNKCNNMGLGFIKYFNWIVDFKNEKVYFKRNDVLFIRHDIIPKYKYLCMIIDKQLKIITKLKSGKAFNINDQIISVNEKQVTTENICEMQDFLNKTQNWDVLKLEVIPKTK